MLCTGWTKAHGSCPTPLMMVVSACRWMLPVSSPCLFEENVALNNCVLSRWDGRRYPLLVQVPFFHHPILLSSNGMLRQPLRFTTIHTWHCRERREACVLVFPAVSTNGWSSPRGPHGRGCGAVPRWLPLSGHRRCPAGRCPGELGAGSSSLLETWSCPGWYCRSARHHGWRVAT